MGVKQHVFGSNAERAVWYKLSRRWGNTYRLFANLPFLMVFDLSDMAGITLQELGRLKKTSIDFTLCDAADKPLLCIEFDGLQDGFNIGAKYQAAEPTNPWRDTITSLKLRVAHGFGFPYLVVGSDQFRDISEAVRLCVVDAIIGSVLAKQALGERARSFTPADVGMTDGAFEALSPSGQDELIAHWFIGAEVEADVTHNPIVVAQHDLLMALWKRLGAVQSTVRYVYKPDIDDTETPQNRARLMDNAMYIGGRCTVTTTQFGAVTRSVWLPNFKTPGFSLYDFLDELAKLVALDAVRRLADARA